MAQDGWPQRLAGAVAAEVRRHRKIRGLSAQQLADACAALGVPIHRQVLANFENGRRPTITLAEVIVLAKALGVPPLALAFPVGHTSMTEVLPGHEIGTWEAARWFTGEVPYPSERDGRWSVSNQDFAAWQDSAISFFREQDDFFGQWNGARGRAESARKAAEVASTEAERQALRREADAEERLIRWVEERLRSHRAEMRKRGINPGELTPNLQHIDQPEVE